MTAYVEEDEGLRDNPSLLVLVQTCTGTLEISTAVSLKMESNLPQDQAIPLLGIDPKGCSIVPQGHLLNYVHSSIICNIQDLKTT